VCRGTVALCERTCWRPAVPAWLSKAGEKLLTALSELCQQVVTAARLVDCHRILHSPSIRRGKYTACPFQTSHNSIHHCRKSVNARRMTFVAYERGTQRILFRDLEVAAPAVVWRYSR
jgi:hypothetical protein